MGSRLAYTIDSPLSTFDVKSAVETIQVTAESLNLILNVKDAAGSTVVVNTVKKPIASMEGAMIGSYWGKKENIVWEGGVLSKDSTSHLLSVTTTGGAAACVIDDAVYDLEKLFESATTCRYVIKVWDTQNRYRYGWIEGISVSGTQYTLSIFNNVTTASGTQDWVGSATIGTVSKFKIYKYSSSIVWGSTDTFTAEVEYEDGQNDLDVLKGLANGEYAIDYKHGRILGRKANGDNTETISYYYLATPLGSATITVDSEFPIAAALGDATANPTTTVVGSMNEFYNGTTWDRGRSGVVTPTATLTGWQNVLDGAVFNTTPTTRTAAQWGPLEAEASGALIVGANLAHDAVDAGNPLKIGGKATDPTSLPAAVASGDRSNIATSLQSEVLVYLSRLISGEDQTNNVLSTVEKPVSVSTYTPDTDTSAAAEASSVTKASAGNLYGFTATNSSGASRYFQFFNSTTVPADTTVPALSYFCAAGGSISDTFVKGRNFTTGIAWAWSSTSATKTIGSTDGIADIRYK